MSRFPATHASVFERIRSDNHDVRLGAFSDLAAGYWKPAYHYVRLQWRLTPEEAEDVVQGFFAVALEKSYLAKFDPAKARFRTFLRTCLDRFLQNQRAAAHAIKRGGSTQTLSLDAPGADRELAQMPAGEWEPDDIFERETTRSVLALAAEDLRQACLAEGRPIVYDTFARHDLRDDVRTYASVAAELGIPVTQVTNHLPAARRRFRDLALARLRSLSGTDAEFRADARALFGVDVDDADGD